MFRIASWLFSLFLLCTAVWFSVMVPLGDKTLVQHLRAIFGTKEAHDLARGVDAEARKVAERVREGWHPTDGGAPKAPKPLDPMAADEQQALDKLVKDKTAPGKPVGEQAGKPLDDKPPPVKVVDRPASKPAVPRPAAGRGRKHTVSR